MRNKSHLMKRLMSILLVTLLTVALCACGAPYSNYTLEPNETLSLEPGTKTNATNRKGQLSAGDIMSMNQGNATIIYGDSGYVTFIRGRFSDVKVTDYEEAITALYGIENLIGLGKGSEFFCVAGSRDDDGYTYYTFQQRYGDVTVEHATLKIIIDPQGYTAGLANSFVPNLGIADNTTKISAEDALNITKNRYADFNLEFYPEHSHEVAITINNASYRAWVIYSNNPESSKAYYGMTYYAHYVAADGSFLQSLPVANFEANNMDAYNASDYFEGMEYYTLKGTVTLCDGTREEIAVPIAYNARTQLYYLMDYEKKIAVADYYKFVYRGEMAFVASSDGVSWNNADLIYYDRYRKAYDFYAKMGMTSVDGTGLPLLVCTNYVDQNGVPVDNACYFGNNLGWACFAASYGNTISQAMDTVTHEFTHGVTSNCAQGNRYSNDSGAINEAYSDIMGNLCEMMYGYTNDTQWLIGERGGQVYRSMSRPHDYRQPTSIRDAYYFPNTDDPNPKNDLGGVHVNSSLLAQMAYILYENGMSMEDECSLWLTTIEMLTPTVSYPEIYASLLLSIDINKFDKSYKDILTEAFQEAGLI